MVANCLDNIMDITTIFEFFVDWREIIDALVEILYDLLHALER